MKFARLFAAATLLFAACSADLPHEAPYDERAPLDKQAKSTVVGQVALKGESDFSQITVELQNAKRTYNTDTQTDGAVRLTGVVPGTYTLSIRTRYFQPVTETVTVTLGDEVNLGSRLLAPLASKVSGSATLETVANNKLVSTGGVTLTLAKTASIRGAAAAPAMKTLAAPVSAQTYRTVSGSDGSYDFSLVSAGVYSLTASSKETGEREIGEVKVTGEGDVGVEPIVLKPLTGFFTIIGKTKRPDGTLQNSSVYTAVPQVALQLSGFNAEKMKIVESTDGQPAGCNLTAAPQLTYDGNYTLTLSSEGVKLVCVTFLDADGKQTDPLYGTITYDATPPSPVNLALSAAGGYTNADSVLASVSAADALSGVATLVTAPTAAGITGATHTPFQSTVVIPFFTAADGAKDVYVRVYDAAGNASVIEHASVVVDRQAPQAAGAAGLTTLGGAAVAGGAVITTRDLLYVSSVADANALEMRVTSNGSFAGVAWEPYAASKAITLAPPAATSLAGEARSVAAEVRDAAGNVTSLAPVITVTLDTLAPTNPSVVINAPATVSGTTVTVTLAAAGTPTAAELAFDPGFLTSLGTAFAPTGTHTVTLPAGDGLKTVYARFFDAAGNASATAGDTVVLDATPPAAAAFRIVETSPTKINPVTLSYAAEGATEFRVTEGAACGGAPEAYGSGTKTLALSGAEGNKTVHLQFFDAVGNASACLAQSVYYDPNPPVVGAFQINYGQAATSSNTVTISFTGVSGATKVLLSEDAGFAGADWQSFAATKTLVLSAGNGTKTVYAQVADDAGNTASLAAKSITIDNTPPSTASIVASAEVTTGTSVTLLLTAGLVSEMMLSQDDPAFTTAVWEPYFGSKVFTLTGTDGTKTIYAKFRKSTGVETSTVSDTVVLDRTGPALPSVRVNNGAAVVSSNVVTLNLSAVDAASGVAAYKINTANAFAAVSPKSYQPNDLYSLSTGDGVKTLWVVFGDKAGNYSAPASVSVTLDSTAPALNSFAVKKLDGTAVASGDTVNDGRLVLVSDVSDLTALEMQVSTTGSFAAMGWEPYSPSKVVDLTGASSSLAVRVRDGAGFVTNLASGFIVNLDRTAPVLSLSRSTAAATNVRDVGLVLSANETSETQVSDDPGFTGAVWFPTGNTTYTLSAGDGLRTIYARARDAAGNVSDVKTVQVTLDETPPQVAAVAITEGALTNQTLLHLQITALGAAEMQLSESAAFAGASWVAYSGTPTFTLPAGEGTRTIYARFRDAAGNTASGYSATTVLDTQGPTAGAWSLRVNGGAATTTQQAVTLALAATGATQMRVSEDPLFTGAAWEGYAAQKAFFLTASQIVHTIYVQFRDDAGNLGATASANVTLDSVAPQVPGISAPAYATQTTVTLTLTAASADLMIVSESLAFTDATWKAYAATSAFTLANREGAHTVYAKYRDTAGNESATVSASVILDTQAPAVTRVALEGTAYSPTATIDLITLATGADTMKLGESADLSAVAAVPYASEGVFAVTGGDGVKTIHVQFQDAAGNQSATYAVTVTLDTAAPALASATINTGAQYAVSRAVKIDLADDGTAAEMQVDEDPLFGGAAWQSYKSTVSYSLESVNDGVKPVYVRLRDRAGNVSAVRTDSITLDTTAPGDVFVVKRDAPKDYATSTSVVLRVNATGADLMQLSTDGTFTAGGWVPFATAGTVAVVAGDGLKNVWVQFKDAAGNLSQIGQTSFFLDTAAPEAGTLAFAQGAATNTRDVFLQLSATGADLFQIATTTATLAAQPMLMMQPGKPLQLPDADGVHTYYVRYLDRAGNASAAQSASITLDRTPPAAGAWSIVVNAGAATTRQAIVALALAATGATEMQVRNDAYFDGAAWEPVTTSTTWFLDQGDGNKQVYVRFRDGAGNVTPAYAAVIRLDTTPPDVSRVVLNGGAEYSNTTTVALQTEVKNAADFAEMQYGADASFATGSGWIAFAQSVNVNLAAGDGTKTVYVQFRDAAGNTSAIFSDSIVLDQTPPATANLSVNSGAAYAKDTAGQVQLVLSATDELAGIADMQLSNSSSFAAAPVVPFYSPRWWTLDTSGGDGVKTVYVRFRDRAGNYSTPVSDTILLDRAAPAGASVTIAKSGGYVTSNVVNVTLAASDANGVTEVMLGTGPAFSSGYWQPFTTSASFVLPAVDAHYYVYAKFRDAAGNEGGVIFDQVDLDTTAPRLDSLWAPSLSNTNVVSVQIYGVGASQMRLSENADFSGAAWVPYVTNTTFATGAAEGAKTIFAQLRDAAGLTSAVRSVNLTLDATAPDRPGVRIRQGDYTKTSTVDVEISSQSATDVLLSQYSAMTDATWQPYASLKSFTFAGGDGLKTVYVKVRDGASNYSLAGTATVTLDRAAPTLAPTPMRINGFASSTTNSSFVTLTFAASGADDLQVSEDMSFAGASWVPYTPARAYTLSPGDGTKILYARFRDYAGNQAGPASAMVVLDTKAPSAPFIAAALAVTNTASVNVTLSAVDADEMKVSLSPDFSGASWVAYATSQSVPLAGADGNKTVYAKFRRAGSGYETVAVSASVLLDRAGPTDAAAELASAVSYVTSTQASLRLSAVDTVSGVESVEISEGSLFFDKDVLSMRSLASYTLRTASQDYHPIYVRYRDRAGNYSATVTLGVVYDVTPPSGTIDVAGGAASVNSQFVTVALASPDADVDHILIYNDSGSPSELPFSPSLVWAIRPIQGVPTTVNVKFVDVAGNASANYGDVVTYDTAPPTVASMQLLVQTSATALNLSWNPSYLAGVTGYTWYRHLNGLKSVGGTVAAAITSVTVALPVAGEEYSVSAWYAGGVPSALSAPAVEAGAFAPTKGVLVVDDDAGATSVEDNLVPALAAAGIAHDTVTVAAGSDGPSSDVLAQYQAVVWSSGQGPTAPTLSAADRDTLKAYLTAGGNLVYLGSDAAADADTATLLKRWMHTGRVETDLPSIMQMYVPAGGLIAAGADFAVGPAMTGADAVYGSALSDEFLNAGKPLAVRYPLPGVSAPYRSAWIGAPTAGLYQRKVFMFTTQGVNIPVTGATLATPGGVALQALDNAAVQVPLPFVFKFGGVTTDTVWVSSNGLVSFQQPITATPYPLFPTAPSAQYPGSFIAPYWVDMRPGGKIFFENRITEVTFVWYMRPVTNYNAMPTTQSTFVLTALTLRDDNQFIMQQDSSYAQYIGQMPNVSIAFEDELGNGLEPNPRSTNDGCCDHDNLAVAAYNFRDTVPETEQWLGALVRWTAAPAGVRRSASRTFTVASSVAGAAWMRVSTDGSLDTEPAIAYDPALPITGFTGGDGAKSVQVVYIDDAGNTTGIYSDTKTLDTEVPKISTVFLIDPATGSNAFTRNRTVTLQILGTASTSDFMRTSESPVFVNAGWVPYVESSTFTLGEGDGAKHVYVWLKDANGNISAPGEGSISLDGVSPATQAMGDEVASAAPFYINTSYLTAEDTLAWADLPAGTDTGAQNSFFQVVTLDWSFPFYGEGQSYLVLWPDGLITLGALDVGSNKPFPGDKSKGGSSQYTRQEIFAAWPAIAPFYANSLAFTKASHGIFFAEGADWVMVRYSGEDSRTLEEINAAVVLFKDGRIKFVYGPGNVDADPLIGTSKGDGTNTTRLAYSGEAALSSVATLAMTPNPHGDAKVKLYYRYRYPTGAGAWTDSGVQADSVFDALTFYPPLGNGTYEFYTVGTDEAGNVESAPAAADLTVLFDDAKPLPPTELSAEADEDSVYVQWTPSTSPDVVAYKIYYGTDLTLAGTDASEGDSPVEIAAADHAKLSNLEPGVETYVVVTAVDHVGNESPRASGAPFLLPHSVRKLTHVNTGAYGDLAVIDQSLLAYGGASGNALVWFDMHDPASPSVVSENSGLTWTGNHLYAADGIAFSGDNSYDISMYGQLVGNGPFDGGDFMTSVTPSTLVWNGSGFSNTVTFAATRFDGTPVTTHPGGNNAPLAAEGDAAFATSPLPGPCGGFCAPWLHAYRFDGFGGVQPLGPKLGLSFWPDAMALQSGLLAISSGQYSNGQYQLVDATNAGAPLPLTTITNVRGSFLSWALDRLVSAGGKILQFHDTGDTAAPSMEASTAFSGTVNDFKLFGNLGIVSTSAGLDLFEFGELLPSRVRTLTEPLDNNVSAVVTSRSYAYVADGSKLLIYRLDALGDGALQLVSTYAPFSANELALVGKYLFATVGHDLYVLDVSNPSQPLLAAYVEASGDNCGTCMGWHNPMSVVGTRLVTSSEVYDISDPSNPQLVFDMGGDMFRVQRAFGEYLVGVRQSTPANVSVYKANADGSTTQIGAYAVTYATDIAVDGHTVYVLQTNATFMCCMTYWYKLTVVDASNPAAPYVVAQYALPTLNNGQGGNGAMMASRGFLYFVARNDYNGSGVIMQVDMRDRTAPQVTLEIQSASGQYLAPPLAVTPDNYLFAAADKELDVFHVTPNVPVRESMHPDTVGAKKTVIGDRYVYFATGNKILQMERRAPALKLALVGAGEVAFSKRGAALQLFDPPGVPAASLTTDGTGRFSLSDTRYDTAGELCTALTNTGRLTCTLQIPSNVPATELVDAYGVRVKTTKTASLRAQKVRRTLTLGGNAVINDLAFSNHKLFAAVSEEPNTGASVEGLYVIDPVSFKADYHNETVMGGFNAYSLVVRDSWAFTGSDGVVKAYEWTTRTTKAGAGVTPGAKVRKLALAHDTVYYIDQTPGGPVLTCAKGAFGGALTSCGYSKSYGSGTTVTTLFAPRPGAVAVSVQFWNGMQYAEQSWIVNDTGTAFTDGGWFDIYGKHMAYVNGTLLVSNFDDSLSLYDLSETPIVNLVRRKFQVGGTVRDFAVSGDVLSIADDAGGGLIYRLK